jgi:hypothetical protein
MVSGQLTCKIAEAPCALAAIVDLRGSQVGSDPFLEGTKT